MQMHWINMSNQLESILHYCYWRYIDNKSYIFWMQTYSQDWLLSFWLFLRLENHTSFILFKTVSGYFWSKISKCLSLLGYDDGVESRGATWYFNFPLLEFIPINIQRSWNVIGIWLDFASTSLCEPQKVSHRG